jgi:hypothetical protein
MKNNKIMKTQLLKDLQTLQSKADNFFTEAQENASEHGAGYFYMARKIDKIIGYLTGTRDQKKIITLTELRKSLIDIANGYGTKTGIDYGISISVDCDELGLIKYSVEIIGLKEIKGRDRYSSRVYSKPSFEHLVAEFKVLLDADVEARKEVSELDKDITVQ